ncbi:unnamed protein product [Brassica napus]|uniref:(rape) hypothetical protein n=1 Tax=Brassica napus TaxID=3708 RepID=A0A816IMM9_BRANA|nr:unnamed protein product [Brassica napus]
MWDPLMRSCSRELSVALGSVKLEEFPGEFETSPASERPLHSSIQFQNQELTSASNPWPVSAFTPCPKWLLVNRRTLKQVSVERVQPPIKSKQDDKDSLLAQIPNKSVSLKPALVTRPRSQTGPKMNLRAAPILEKASTIRQPNPSLCRLPSNKHQVLSDSECGSEYEEDVACGYPSLCRPLVRAPSNKHQVLSDSECGSDYQEDVAGGYHTVNVSKPITMPSYINKHRVLSDSECDSDYEEEYLTVVYYPTFQPNPSLCRPLVCAPSNNHQVLSDSDCSDDEEDVARGYHIV